MKSLKFEVQDILNKPIKKDHRRDERIDRLEKLVLFLAEVIDIHRENAFNHPATDE